MQDPHIIKIVITSLIVYTLLWLYRDYKDR